MADHNRTDDHCADDHAPVHRAADNPRADDHSAQTVHRPWRQIAEAVLKETDHEKILRLAQELCDAVDEQVLGRRGKT